MRTLAEIATSRGGTVLEVGFGMGISAWFIQEHEIERHVIIEANHDVAQRAREFAGTACHSVDVLVGLWEEVVAEIPDGTIDGILFDSYPLTDAELFKNHFPFFPHAWRMLRGGYSPTTRTRSETSRRYTSSTFSRLDSRGSC